MARCEDGGQAFPRQYIDGMSIRDYFAGQALKGMLAHGTRYRPRREGQPWHEAIAEESYQLADAMVVERAKED